MSTSGRNEWQRRIDRAEELAARYASAAEILGFYGAIARFQEKFYRDLEGSRVVREVATEANPFGRRMERELARKFRPFLSVVERSGPGKLRELARELAARDEDSHLELLAGFWEKDGMDVSAGTVDFFARAFLQPYAVASDHIRFWTRSWRLSPGVAALLPYHHYRQLL